MASHLLSLFCRWLQQEISIHFVSKEIKVRLNARFSLTTLSNEQRSP
jgi:hypothetical protein